MMFSIRSQICWMISVMAILLTGCLDSGQLTDSTSENPNENGSFSGCTTGYGVDTSRIRIEFEFPSQFEKMSVYRNGLLVYSTLVKSNTSFIDSGLLEGNEYEYACEGQVGQKIYVGKKILTLHTLSSSPPAFAGITSATVLSSSSVQTSWNPPGPGPVATKFKVYGNPGTTVDWAIAPKTIVNASGVFTQLISNLGDELPYSFGVRACTADNQCDSNTVEIDVATSDGGVTGTSGIASGYGYNGSVFLNVPWVESNGATLKRKIYQKIGGGASTNIADYTLIQTQFVASLHAPPTLLEVAGVSELTTYHFIVRDEDPSGNTETNTNVYTIATGDLTAPVFSGISNLVLGTNVQSELDASFTAIDRESVEATPTAASHYQVWLTQSLYPGVPADPCTSGSLWQEVLTNSIAPGAYVHTITGLAPRTTYKVCLKARDTANNNSNNTNFLSVTTLDTVAPAFDNIQSISFDSGDTEVDVFWNPSTSSDIKEYKVQMWINTATPLPGDITTFVLDAATYPSGTSFTSAQYAFTDSDTVYAIVDACDDANTLPGGTQNCTSNVTGSALSVVIPDVSPPPGFTGIKTAGDLVSPSEGVMTVKWFEPTWVPDYYGFKIYTVNPDNSLNWLKDCACATPGSCNAGDTQCNVSGLDPFRTYKFHVRAYDALNNITQLDPVTSNASKRVLDTTQPNFSSALVLGASPTYQLSWNAATDNQYASEPGATITYDVYRKANTSFATSTDPAADGSLRASTTNTFFTDSGLVEGTQYFYAVCARDSSNNTKCDGNIKNFVAPDSTPPVISNFASNKTNNFKKWDLTWTMSDNSSATADIDVRIYERISNTPETATTADTLIFNDTSTGPLTATNLTGPLNADKYVNYLIEIEDEAGNKATANLSLESNNTITLTSVKRNDGPTGGGKLIVIHGTGFSIGSSNNYGTSTVVTVGGSACNNTAVHSSTVLSCETPAGSAGGATVILSNPEGSSTVLPSGYTYLASSTHICDTPGSWGTYFAAGAGSSGNPFIICDWTQFNELRNTTSDGSCTNFRTGSCYYELADNLDFDSTGFTPITTGFRGYIDGNGHVIANFTYSNPAQDNVGLFVRTSGGDFELRNIGLVNVNITARNQVGGIVGFPGASSNFLLDNVFVTGQITGNQSVGGFIGQSTTDVVYNIQNSFSNTTVSATSAYAGGIAGLLAHDGGILNNVHNLGQVTNTGSSYTGGLLGGFRGQMTNSYNTGDIIGVSSVGGLVGLMSYGGSTTDLIQNSYSIGNISGTSASLGGLVGQVLNGTVDNSYATGNVTCLSCGAAEYFGGLIGASISATITNSYATGDVHGHRVGGLVGGFRNGGTLSDSYSTGNVTSTGNSYMGGLIGFVDHYTASSPAIIERSYATGNVGDSVITGNYAGGIIGYLYTILDDVTVSNCHSSGTIQVSAQAGGLIGGSNVGSGITLTVENSYTTSFVQADNSQKGAIIGVISGAGTVTGNGNFWNTNTDPATAIGTGTFSGTATGKTTTEMQDQIVDIYGGAGWDFGTPVWKWCTASGVYPTLDWATCP